MGEKMDSKGIVEKADSKKMDSKGVVEKADFRGHNSCLIRLGVGVIVSCVVVAAIICLIIRVTGINDSNTTHQYIEDMYVPSLDAASLNKTTTTFNTSIYVDLKFERSAALTRLGYPNDFQMSLFYGQYTKNNSLVDSHIVKGFNMKRKTRVHRVKVVVEAAMMPWQQWIQATSSGNVVPIVVELKGVYQYKQIGCDDLDGPVFDKFRLYMEI